MEKFQLKAPEPEPERFEMERWARKFLAQLSPDYKPWWDLAPGMVFDQETQKWHRVYKSVFPPADFGALFIGGTRTGRFTSPPEFQIIGMDMGKVDDILASFVVRGAVVAYESFTAISEEIYRKAKDEAKLRFYLAMYGHPDFCPSRPPPRSVESSAPEPIANAFGKLYDGNPVEIDPDAEFY